MLGILMILLFGLELMLILLLVHIPTMNILKFYHIMKNKSLNFQKFIIVTLQLLQVLVKIHLVSIILKESILNVHKRTVNVLKVNVTISNHTNVRKILFVFTTQVDYLVAILSNKFPKIKLKINHQIKFFGLMVQLTQFYKNYLLINLGTTTFI